MDNAEDSQAEDNHDTDNKEIKNIFFIHTEWKEVEVIDNVDQTEIIDKKEYGRVEVRDTLTKKEI